MNLHGIAAGAVAAVNPQIIANWQQSDGYTTAADGSQTPAYVDQGTITVQMQPLTFRDLVQLEGLNLNGEKRAFYTQADVQGASRPDGLGGDVLTLDADGSVWLCVQILERFSPTSGWTKIAAVRQIA